jgi:hypothetical protein
MSWKNITSGEKVGKAKRARWVKPKDCLGLEVEFEFTQHTPGELGQPATQTQELRSWVAWFPVGNAKQHERVMETLRGVLGFNGNDQADPTTGVLTDPNAFDWSREVQLVVEMENFQGKDYPKIQWVNELCGSQFKAAEPATVKNDLTAIGFKALFLASQKAAGGPAKPKTQAPASTPAARVNTPPAQQSADPDGIPW